MFNNLIKRHYDPAAGEGGGVIPPSLADLSNPDYVPPANVLDAQKAADEAAAAQKAIDDAAAAGATEGVNPDGTLMDGYTKNEDGTITKTVADAPEPADTGDDTPEDFFADVDKLHGTTLKVEYPEGVEPFSPEGIYHREKVVAANAVETFEAYLKQSDPRSYAYMLHRQAGGDDETFYANKTYSLPEYSTFKDNADLQVKLYKSSLLSKGLDDDTAQMAVDKAIKDGALFEKADAAYKTAEQSHEAELRRIEATQAQAEQAYTSSVNQLNRTLTTVINEGKGMRFIIPDTEKANFTAFVKQHVEYEDGKFLLVQRIGDNLTQQLESLYLLYRKGDLNELIKNKAQTQNVQRFKRAVDKSKQAPASGADDTAKPGGFVALGSL